MGVRLLALFPVPAAGFWSDAGRGRSWVCGLRGVRRGCGWGAVGEGQAVSVSWRRGRGWGAGVLEFVGCWRVVLLAGRAR